VSDIQEVDVACNVSTRVRMLSRSSSEVEMRSSSEVEMRSSSEVEMIYYLCPQ
jgi:hypothetical protein